MGSACTTLHQEDGKTVVAVDEGNTSTTSPLRAAGTSRTLSCPGKRSLSTMAPRMSSRDNHASAPAIHSAETSSNNLTNHTMTNEVLSRDGRPQHDYDDCDELDHGRGGGHDLAMYTEPPPLVQHASQRGPFDARTALTADDDDALCDRDDDPPMVDDEGVPAAASPETWMFQQLCYTAARKRRSIPNAPSLHSARKSTVSFSESVSIHYGAQVLQDDVDEEDDRGTMTFDLEVAECAYMAMDDDGMLQSPTQDARQPPAPPAMNSSLLSGSYGTHFTRRGPLQEDTGSMTAMIAAVGGGPSEVSSATSSRGTVITVALANDTRHREQRARPRI